MNREKQYEDPVLTAIRRRREGKKKTAYHEPQGRPVPRERKQQKQDQDLMINPLTNRPMKIGGRAHKAYLKKIEQNPDISKPSHRPKKRKRNGSDELNFNNEMEQVVAFARTILPEEELKSMFSTDQSKNKSEEDVEYSSGSDYSDA